MSFQTPFRCTLFCWLEVLMRIGFMDRSLHLLSCGRWKPKTSSKFLRQAGYCMGYPRFGAILALLSARACIGIPITMDSPLVKLSLINLAGEFVEDFLSMCCGNWTWVFCLWCRVSEEVKLHGSLTIPLSNGETLMGLFSIVIQLLFLKWTLVAAKFLVSKYW